MKINVWILCVLFWNASAYRLDLRCTRPTIRGGSWTVYKKTQVVDVEVRQCGYEEKRVFYKCKDGIRQPDVENTKMSTYFDITENCVNASRNGTFLDKRGDFYEINKIVTHTTKCENGTAVMKTVNMTVRSYTTKADLIQDEIQLESGKICKYSQGFCYDSSKTLNGVVWQIQMTNYNFSCNTLVPVQLKFDYVTVGCDKYLVNENKDKAFALRLLANQTDCNETIWAIDKYELIATERRMVQFDSFVDPLERGNYLNVEYAPRQNLIELLIQSCNNSGKLPSGQQIEDALYKLSLESANLKEMLKSVSRTKQMLEKFEAYLLVTWCIITVISLYVLVNIGVSICNVILNFSTLRKANRKVYKCVIQGLVNRLLFTRGSNSLVKNVQENLEVAKKPPDATRNNPYEYVTEEYDTNEFYNKVPRSK